MSSGTHNDTIAAISTPPGEGGVGIVRLSGPGAVQTASALFVSPHGRSPLTHPRQRVFHGHIHDAAGRVLDEVLLHVMRAPRSYTREDVVEINAHGGPAPLRAILEEALRHGCRLARPGEFTQRAFLNGRLDLVQAEAVIDRIRARTDAALRAANAAASGELSAEMRRLRETLADALARADAAVDFPEEDLPELVDAAFFDRLRGAAEDMRRLLDTARAGRLYREGAEVAVIGRPNVGKSSLFNALLRDTRAIVSPTPGTTRDALGEQAQFGGVPVRLVDTAGIRDADNDIERQGVDLARRALRSAQVIVLVLDAADGWTPEDRLLADETVGTVPVILAANKTDLAPAPAEGHGNLAPPLAVSAKTGAGLRELEEALAAALLGGAAPREGGPQLTRLHQEDSLRRTLESVERALHAPEGAPECLASDLRAALHALGEITGETTPEDLLDRIFSAFCIGK